jgi:hypothetical protein
LKNTHPFIEVVLNGGLGNQLFGWAIGQSIASLNDYNLILNSSQLVERQYELSKFKISAVDCHPQQKKPYVNSGINQKLGRLIRPKLYEYEERSFNFDNRFLKIPPDKTIYGYFQSWKYFKDCEIELRNFLLANYIESEEYIKIKKEISGREFIVIHVRRGDYISKKNFHALTSKEYYEQALKQCKSSSGTLIVCFSDSIDIAKKILPGCDYYFGPKDINDPAAILMVMSQSKALIGSNSTLSWWAAFLMDINAVKIFPSRWFTKTKINTDDLIPSTWKRI